MKETCLNSQFVLEAYRYPGSIILHAASEESHQCVLQHGLICAGTDDSISNVRKRRGVIRSSLTKLITKTKEIESSGSPLKRDRAQQALIKLDSLDNEFRAQHFQLIDYLEEEDELSEQQEVLDQTDDDIATMRFRLIKWTTRTRA